MIFLDTSVALAQLLAEDRRPPDALWNDTVVASRLLEYELWSRIHARGLGGSHGAAVRALLAHVAFVELAAPVLARALEPCPLPVRTLDALHLATADFLRARLPRSDTLRVATYDDRMAAAATALGFALEAI